MVPDGHTVSGKVPETELSSVPGNGPLELTLTSRKDKLFRMNIAILSRNANPCSTRRPVKTVRQSHTTTEGGR